MPAASKKVKLTKTLVETMAPGDYWNDAEQPGLIVRCVRDGRRAYFCRYTVRETGQSRWSALGFHGTELTLQQARSAAARERGKAKGGNDPVIDRREKRAATRIEQQRERLTVDKLLDDFLERYPREKKLRSLEERRAVFVRHVRPKERIGAHSIYELRKRDMVKMLDKIADENGPVISDRVLAYLRKAFNWHASRDDDFKSPLTGIKPKTDPRERSRDRVLTDDEIRSVWLALDSPEAGAEPFRRLVRVLLLTAQRRNEVAGLHADEMQGKNWTIAAARYKTGKEHLVPLSDEALRWIAASNYQHKFSTGRRGDRPFSGFSKGKAALDAVIAEQRKAAGLKQIPNWTLHDLRRTARTLLSRAKIAGDIGEMVVGHALPIVRGTYDLWAFADEKRDALEKLATLIAYIVNPASNVVPIKGAQHG